ncbi:hypothetical protein [Rhodococcus sp. 21391]|uniref:hypothetical protein n=1 Tax=Rhodococcus sp. 21391 TaxID=2683591 RepID=UPI001ED92DDF|nr:hypothetical protein [Rhodococcus sp. 21391]
MEHDPGAMLRRQEALGRDYSDDEIRRLYTRGEWRRIGRGAYLSASMYSQSEEERHRFLIDSTVHAVSDDVVLSHQSAAVVYGLPLWKTPLDGVHLTRNRRGGGRIKRRTTVHCAPIGEHVAVVDGHSLTLPTRTVVDLARTLPFEQAVVMGDAAVVYGLPLWKTPLDGVHLTRNRRGGGRIKRRTTVHCAPIGEHVAVVDGHSLTLPTRTVVDLARTLPFEQAVVMGDAAVRRFGVDREDLEAELARAARRHGVDAARRVVRFLSGHSESVGESRSRVMLSRAGLPLPSQQGEVFEPGGRRIGRVDFHFDGIVLGEFDGRVKYGRLLKPGQSPGDAVFAEKQREDALRDLGFQVVRWTWDDLESPGQVAERVRRAIARAATPRGWVTQAPLPSAQRLTVRSL